MKRDRSKSIGIELNEESKKIYDELPRHIKKGEYVSEAIIEKHERGKNQPLTIKYSLEELDKRISALEEKIKAKLKEGE